MVSASISSCSHSASAAPAPTARSPKTFSPCSTTGIQSLWENSRFPRRAISSASPRAPPIHTRFHPVSAVTPAPDRTRRPPTGTALLADCRRNRPPSRGAPIRVSIATSCAPALPTNSVRIAITGMISISSSAVCFFAAPCSYFMTKQIGTFRIGDTYEGFPPGQKTRDCGAVLPFPSFFRNPRHRAGREPS